MAPCSTISSKSGSDYLPQTPHSLPPNPPLISLKPPTCLRLGGVWLALPFAVIHLGVLTFGHDARNVVVGHCGAYQRAWREFGGSLFSLAPNGELILWGKGLEAAPGSDQPLGGLGALLGLSLLLCAMRL